MKNLIASLTIIMLLAACGSDTQESVVTAEEPAKEPVQPAKAGNPDLALAKSVVKEFSTALGSELKQAMEAGGPVAAIAICNTKAMPITEQVAARHGIQLGRVSVKNRNPGNAPNKWQAAVLKRFDRQKANGKDPKNLSWSNARDTGEEFRFMKAIPTTEVCLKCHGATLAPEVSEALASLYPEDLATGYSVGDIRGAFVVTRKLP